MPTVTQQEVNLLKQHKKLKEQIAALDSKQGRLSQEERGKLKDLSVQLDAVETSMTSVNSKFDMAISNLADLATGTRSVITGFEKLGAGKTDDYLREIGEQTNKSAESIGVMADNLKQLNLQGKGTSDMAKIIEASLAIESDILGIYDDKSKLLATNLIQLEAEVDLAIELLGAKTEENATEYEKLRQQRQSIINLQAQQSRAKNLNDLESKAADLHKKVAEFAANFATQQGVALLATGAIVKALQFGVKETLSMQNAIGGTVGESAVLAAQFRANLSVAQNITGAFTGVNKNIKEAAIQSALAADNLDLMNNMAVAVSDATLAMQVGLDPSNVAQLAQMMSEVTDSSRESASAQLVTVQALATANKVAPSKVFESMSQNATVLAAMTDGSAESMGRLAVQAAKAGVELSSLESIADSLLNIESSIASEFEAEVLLGKQLNLDAARRFALNNDNEGLIREIQKNLQGTSFGELNRLQRQSLAAALGTDVGSLSKMMGRADNQELVDVQDQQLKGIGELNTQGAMTNDLLGEILRGVQFLAIAQAAGGIADLAKTFGNFGGGNAGMLAQMMTKGGNFAKNNPRLAKGLRFGGGGLAAAGVGFNAYQNFTDDSLSGGMAALKTLDQNKATALLTGLAAYGTLGMGIPAAAALGQTIDAFLPNIGSLFGAYANGGPVTESGMAMVGERGPELVALGRGSHVVPNHYLGGFATGATNMQIADPATHNALQIIAGHLESIKGTNAKAADGIKNMNISTGR
tara:strand:+ start:215 stop:2479 length:2265 start_codon:yes stop_codon:yes gene_type:complete